MCFGNSTEFPYNRDDRVKNRFFTFSYRTTCTCAHVSRQINLR